MTESLEKTRSGLPYIAHVGTPRGVSGSPTEERTKKAVSRSLTSPHLNTDGSVKPLRTGKLHLKHKGGKAQSLDASAAGAKLGGSPPKGNSPQGSPKSAGAPAGVLEALSPPLQRGRTYEAGTAASRSKSQPRKRVAEPEDEAPPEAVFTRGRLSTDSTLGAKEPKKSPVAERKTPPAGSSHGRQESDSTGGKGVQKTARMEKTPPLKRGATFSGRTATSVSRVVKPVRPPEPDHDAPPPPGAIITSKLLRVGSLGVRGQMPEKWDPSYNLSASREIGPPKGLPPASHSPASTALSPRRSSMGTITPDVMAQFLKSEEQILPRIEREERERAKLANEKTAAPIGAKAKQVVNGAGSTPGPVARSSPPKESEEQVRERLAREKKLQERLQQQKRAIPAPAVAKTGPGVNGAGSIPEPAAIKPEESDDQIRARLGEQLEQRKKALQEEMGRRQAVAAQVQILATDAVHEVSERMITRDTLNVKVLNRIVGSKREAVQKKQFEWNTNRFELHAVFASAREIDEAQFSEEDIATVTSFNFSRSEMTDDQLEVLARKFSKVTHVTLILNPALTSQGVVNALQSLKELRAVYIRICPNVNVAGLNPLFLTVSLEELGLSLDGVFEATEGLKKVARGSQLKRVDFSLSRPTRAALLCFKEVQQDRKVTMCIKGCEIDASAIEELNQGRQIPIDVQVGQADLYELGLLRPPKNSSGDRERKVSFADGLEPGTIRRKRSIDDVLALRIPQSLQQKLQGHFSSGAMEMLQGALAAARDGTDEVLALPDIDEPQAAKPVAIQAAPVQKIGSSINAMILNQVIGTKPKDVERKRFPWDDGFIDLQPVYATVAEISEGVFLEEDIEGVVRLSFFRTDLTDKKLIALCHRFPNINYVALIMNPELTDKGIVTALLSLSHLRSIYIRTCPKMTAAGFNTILNAVRGTTISFAGENILCNFDPSSLEELGLTTDCVIEATEGLRTVAKGANLRRVDFCMSELLTRAAFLCFKGVRSDMTIRMFVKGCPQIDLSAIEELNLGRENPIEVEIGVADVADRYELGLPRPLPAPDEFPESDEIFSMAVIWDHFNLTTVPDGSVIDSSKGELSNEELLKTPYDPFLEKFKDFREFKGLSWSGNVRNNSVAAFVARFPRAEAARFYNCKNLEMGLSTLGIVHVGRLSKLKTLYIGKCPGVTQKGFERLFGDPTSFRELEDVHLAGMPVSNKVVKALASSPLKKANLSFCNQITWQGLQHLIGCKTLEKLTIYGCRWVNSFDVAEFRKARPDVILEADGIFIDPVMNALAIEEGARVMWSAEPKYFVFPLTLVGWQGAPVPENDLSQYLVEEESVSQFYTEELKRYGVIPRQLGIDGVIIPEDWMRVEQFLQAMKNLQRVAAAQTVHLIEEVGFFTDQDPDLPPATTSELIQCMMHNPTYAHKTQFLPFSYLGITHIPGFVLTMYLDQAQWPYLEGNPGLGRLPQEFREKLPMVTSKSLEMMLRDPLASLPWQNKEEVNLAGIPVSDEALMLLVRMHARSETPKLKSVDLSFCDRITWQGVQEFIKCGSLKSLSLVGCRTIDLFAIEEIRKKRPDVQLTVDKNIEYPVAAMAIAEASQAKAERYYVFLAEFLKQEKPILEKELRIPAGEEVGVTQFYKERLSKFGIDLEIIPQSWMHAEMILHAMMNISRVTHGVINDLRRANWKKAEMLLKEAKTRLFENDQTATLIIEAIKTCSDDAPIPEALKAIKKKLKANEAKPKELPAIEKELITTLKELGDEVNLPPDLVRTRKQLKENDRRIAEIPAIIKDLKDDEKLPRSTDELLAFLRISENAARIKHLDLSGLGITDIPTIFYHNIIWPRLRSMNLEGTLMRNLPGNFKQQCPQLERVSCADNMGADYHVEPHSPDSNDEKEPRKKSSGAAPDKRGWLKRLFRIGKPG